MWKMITAVVVFNFKILMLLLHGLPPLPMLLLLYLLISLASVS